MSGGHFDYEQSYIQYIADSLENYLYGRELDESDIEDYINDFWNPLSDEEKAWIYKHKRTLPNLYEYSPETISEFKKGLNLLRKAYIYAQRIDWLLSGDDGEESFHERLKDELTELEKGGKQ
ncbi:MAG: hypothetical protein K2K82_00960 [Muribaculaceae bacterium]|nr:hypothetical protein [Muribaculaceae bacterium]